MKTHSIVAAISFLAIFVCSNLAIGQTPPLRGKTSYAPVSGTESFESVKKRMSEAKARIVEDHKLLLKKRYDLSDHSNKTTHMSRGKDIQSGVRVKLGQGVTWESLAQMKSQEIKAKNLWPEGLYPLPHPNHAEGGMLFPDFHIKEIEKQTKRDLSRFDLDFVMPDHFLPAYPPAMFLTTRPDLGDVSQGKVITSNNYFDLFNGLLNPKQIEGLRLLVTPTQQQQFNATHDRRSVEPSLGVSCFDCHVNGHTNAATHLVGDIRPQEFRHRLDTPTLRGVNVQRLFGSQRALKTIEDFTQFEQRGAYFDGDHVIAAKKGVNILERGSQVHFMAEFEAILGFPPAPKIRWDGKLDPSLASASELRGQDLFFGKAKCASCHSGPHFTDNTMHDLKVERFFEPKMINGRFATADGMIKTFPLRGIKDSPPYLHDGRLLTLDDTVEFFNLVLELKLSKQEKSDVVDFLLTL